MLNRTTVTTNRNSRYKAMENHLRRAMEGKESL